MQTHAIFIACYVVRVRGKAWERGYAVSTTEVSSPSDIFGGDGVSEDVPDTGVPEVGGRELVII